MVSCEKLVDKTLINKLWGQNRSIASISVDQRVCQGFTKDKIQEEWAQIMMTCSSIMKRDDFSWCSMCATTCKSFCTSTHGLVSDK